MALAAAAHHTCFNRALQVLAASAALTDVQKMRAEWFDDKLVSLDAAAAAAAVTHCTQTLSQAVLCRCWQPLPAESAALTDVQKMRRRTACLNHHGAAAHHTSFNRAVQVLAASAVLADV
jgi:hypothetical protein